MPIFKVLKCGVKLAVLALLLLISGIAHGQSTEQSREGLVRTIKCHTAVVVHFPDQNLEQAIRDAIGKPTGEIFSHELENLTELIAEGPISFEHYHGADCEIIYDFMIPNESAINDLEGIQYCTNLEILNLGGNQISDLTPISDLVNLESLSLYCNQISDITPLSNLSKLSRLQLHYNLISDIKPLVSNPAIGEGFYLELGVNPLNGKTRQVLIPRLIERGAEVWWQGVG